ncbi:MAG: PKD domain-containing protein, partial [Thermodesulfobacteria bacterium]|nr:PKD domain-containing protein [Thermodesulfobacteriota bacterium]
MRETKLAFFTVKTLSFLLLGTVFCFQARISEASDNDSDPPIVISTFEAAPNPVPNPLESVRFTIQVTSTSSPISCSVDLGDGSIEKKCDPFTHSYQKAGTYNVSLEVTDTQGNKATKTITLTVADKVPAKVTGLTISLVSNEKSTDGFQDFISGKGQAPTLQEYQQLGITGVTLKNLDGINYFLMEHWPWEVDSPEKLQALVDEFNQTERGIGANPVEPTPAAKGTLFASPSGSGDQCSLSAPCSIGTAFSKLKAADVLFLRGGTYTISSVLRVGASGSEENPIIIESYPGEWAVLQGLHGPGADLDANVRINGISVPRDQSHVYIRRLEVKDMGWAGIALYGSYNLVEGCNIHHNLTSGVVLYGGEWHEDRPNYQIPYPNGFNIVRDNVIHDNSDANLPSKGGNSDGIAVSSGRYNKICHNTVYSNSDDGIDLWRSNYSYVAFNISFKNGLALGDGQGFKTGGNLNPQATNGLGANVQHNISYQNKRNGFDVNAGKQVTFRYNTAWKNGRAGFVTDDDTTVEFNIAAENASPTQIKQGHHSNSWQTDVEPEFVSKDPSSKDFLRP